MLSGRIPIRGVVFVPLLLAPLALVSSEKLTTEQMLTRHRSQGMSGTLLPDGHVRELRGTATMVTPSQTAVVLEGTFGFTSAAGSSRVVLQFGTPQVPRESPGARTDGTSRSASRNRAPVHGRPSAFSCG